MLVSWRPINLQVLWHVICTMPINMIISLFSCQKVGNAGGVKVSGVKRYRSVVLLLLIIEHFLISNLCVCCMFI